MPATRVDNFIGDDRAYAGYLYETLTGLPLPECIRQLEEQVKVHRSQRRTSSSLSAELDDEVPSPPSIRSLETRHPSPPSLCFELWSPEQLLPSSRPPVTRWKQLTASFFKGLPKTEDEWSWQYTKIIQHLRLTLPSSSSSKQVVGSVTEGLTPSPMTVGRCYGSSEKCSVKSNADFSIVPLSYFFS
ncbi:hypothetical protein QBC46DRAFT_348654, partial [Diplogelasinospora grovesii]